MKIIRNNIIPFRGFKAMNLFGVLFVRGKDTVLTDSDIRHETIHTAQMKETLYVPFYVLYLLMYAWMFLRYGSGFKAYRNIPFEREAYWNERKPTYLGKRKPWAWLRYLGRENAL